MYKKNGKKKYIPGHPRPKATQYQIDESGPAIRIPKKYTAMQIQKQSNPLKPKFKVIHMDNSKPVYKAFTDGACDKNGKEINKGAWGFVIVNEDKIVHCTSNMTENTTNNRMELKAIIECLREIEVAIPDTQVLLHTDSQYCYHGICTWRHGWIRKQWKDVKNVEQWQELSSLVDRLPNVQYKWIRAHQDVVQGSGNSAEETKWNCYVDQLCQQAYSKEPLRERGITINGEGVDEYIPIVPNDPWEPFISREEGSKLRMEMKEIYENSKSVDKIQELSDELKEANRLLVRMNELMDHLWNTPGISHKIPYWWQHQMCAVQIECKKLLDKQLIK